MTPHESAPILEWLQTQRWYGDKSRSLDSHAVVSLGTVDCDAGRIDLLIVECGYKDGGRSSYFTPLKRDGSLVDAFRIPAFLEWFASGFPSGRTLRSANRTMTWIAGPGSDTWTDVAIQARVINVEQSNTSIRFGDRAIAKVFRRLQSGLNPDVEIISYLTDQSVFRHVPIHFGTVVIQPESPSGSITLAAVQGFVANEGDGWAWMLRELAAHSPDGRDVLLDPIELLGIRTAELHIALATDTTKPSFTAVVMTTRDVDDMANRLTRELDHTIAGLIATGARSKHALTLLRETLAADVATAVGLAGLLKTRVHGDYHLGQVLRTTTDWVIIDFEGEPSRSMDERRQKTSPLKDVAGMLRSLDYAVATHERNNPTPEQFSLIEWGERARSAFLRGYTKSIQSSSIELVPACGSDFEDALDLFMIEKALYEIRYELDNRPSWLDIPLRALERLANQSSPALGSADDGAATNAR